MKPAQKIINQAKQIAREESQEFLKSTQEQFIPISSQPERPETKTAPLPPQNDYLEEEMQRYRELRRQKEEEIFRQKELEEKENQETTEAPIFTNSKPKGPLMGMKAKLQKLQLGGEVRGDKSKD